MKEVIITLFVMLAIVFGLSSCSETNGEVTYIVRPSMKIYSEKSGFNYVVDKKTKVVYILYKGWEYGGLCPCLKPDGALMLASDLGLE